MDSDWIDLQRALDVASDIVDGWKGSRVPIR